jgi:hypothetical protein
MSTSNNPGSTPSRKRRRPPVVCTECRRRKAACDRKMPCAQCTQYDLTCVYQSNTSAPRCSAPGLSVRSPTSTINNAAPEDPSISVTASDEAIANVASSCITAIPTVDPQEPTPPDSNPNVPVDDILNTAIRPLLRTSGKSRGAPRSQQQPQTRAWVNSDGSLVPIDHSLSTQGSQTNSLKGRYLKSRLFGQSHWMNSCIQVSFQHFRFRSVTDTTFPVRRTNESDQ